MPPIVPKAVLYYHPQSVWSVVVLLCLDEKGYGADELDFRVVDLANGENYDPAFLRLNPKATIPTLVVPLQKTLSEDVESRYKAITDSRAIAEFLDKSRSAQSRTNTTSGAPAPKLAPATIGFMTKSNEIIELVHSEAGDPEKLWYLTGRDEGSLRKHSLEVLPILRGKEKALSRLLEEASGEKIQVSERTKKFWADKKEEVQKLLNVFMFADKPSGELSGEERLNREEFFATARSGWAGLKGVVEAVDEAVIGPYALGDQICIADMHLVGWLAEIGKLVGGSKDDDGDTVVKKLREYVGSEIEGKKIKMYWEAVKGRESWRRV